MKMKYVLMVVLAVTLVISSMASARLLVAYNGNSVGLFTDNGILIRNYSTTLGNAQGVTADSSGNVYVADAGGVIKMYNSETGVFIRDIAKRGSGFGADFLPLGLGFNPNNPGEILATCQYASVNIGQLLRLNTNATNSTPAYFNGGIGYNGIAYNNIANNIISAIPAANIAQTFNPTTFELLGNTLSITGGPRAVTVLGGVVYYGTQAGTIRNSSDTLIYNFGTGKNAYCITNNGTDLIAGEYNGGTVAIVSVTGTLISSFSLPQVTGVAYVSCAVELAGDLNGDCTVDFKDFAIMAAEWLQCNREPQSDCLP